MRKLAHSVVRIINAWQNQAHHAGAIRSVFPQNLFPF